MIYGKFSIQEIYIITEVLNFDINDNRLHLR